MYNKVIKNYSEYKHLVDMEITEDTMMIIKEFGNDISWSEEGNMLVPYNRFKDGIGIILGITTEILNCVDGSYPH